MPPVNRPVRRAFARAAVNYEAAAQFQRDCGERLGDGLPDLASPRRALDLGCGTGRGGALIAERWPGCEIVAVDFALPMLRQLPPGPRAMAVCADAAAVPLAGDGFDLVWSNLTLQWCEPALFFTEAARLLRPGGLLAASTLGPATFCELRAAFAAADDYRHTIAFSGEAELRRQLAGAGLQLRALRREAQTRHYDRLPALLAEVRDIGANAVGGAAVRRGLMGKSTWSRFADAYERQRQGPGLPLSYEALFIYAGK